MAYHMSITLTNEESAEAAENGKQPEILLREIMQQRLQPVPTASRPLTARELAEQLYREGKLLNLATRRPLTREELAERERLAQMLADDKPLSEIVIEDRGPY